MLVGPEEIENPVQGKAAVPTRRADCGQQAPVAPPLQGRLADPDGSGNLFGGEGAFHGSDSMDSADAGSYWSQSDLYSSKVEVILGNARLTQVFWTTAEDSCALGTRAELWRV